MAARCLGVPSLAALCSVAALAWATPARADTTAPTIVHTPITEAHAGVAIKITVDILDDSGVFEPKLHYRAAGSTAFMTMSLIQAEGATYSATIPGVAVIADLEYFVEAYDTQGNGPARAGSDEAPQRIRIVAAPEPPKVADVPMPPAVEVVVAKAAEPPFRPPLFAAGASVAAGAVAAGVGVYFATQVLDPKVGVDASRSAATGATACFAIAGVAAAVGVGLAIWHFAPTGEEQGPGAVVSVSPRGVLVSGRF